MSVIDIVSEAGYRNRCCVYVCGSVCMSVARFPFVADTVSTLLLSNTKQRQNPYYIIF